MTDLYDPATDPAVKPVTREDLVEALKNDRGLKHIKAFFTEQNTRGEVTGACALGIAAINLSVNPDSLYNHLDDLCPVNETGEHFHYGEIITTLNDNDNVPLREIAQWIETHIEPFKVYVGKQEFRVAQTNE